VLALVVVLIAAVVVLWLRGRQQEAALAISPLPVTLQTSPLPTPTSIATEESAPSFRSGSAALLWVVLGGMLALGIAFLIFRRPRQDTQ
jgi:hypothetical protein